MIINVFSMNYDYICALHKHVKMQITLKLVPKRISIVLNVFSVNFDDVCAFCKRVMTQITLQLVPKHFLNAFEWF